MVRFSTARIVSLIFTTLLFIYYTTNGALSPLTPAFSFFQAPTCAPDAWNAGQWEHSPRPTVAGVNDTALSRSEDIFKYNGMRGCAADREFYWHLAADNVNHFSRFPGVTEWEWQPAKGCRGVAPLSPEAFVKDLVEKGSWLLLGDSVTENHFFSLSCSLFPHVRATPNYTENPYFDRAWPQHLYLDPNSPLLPHLSLPPSFSIAETPLVTFRRIDLLLTRAELETMHKAKHPEIYGPEGGFTLFSEEQHWGHSPEEYMTWFTAPPPMRYGTLLANTGGHWTTTLFAGFRDETATDDGYGIKQLLPFFAEAMEHWAREVQSWMDRERMREKMEALDEERGKAGTGLRREVVVRAYLPGHEDCHDWHEPWREWHPYHWNWYNWAWISDMNTLFQKVLASPAYPDVHFLPIDRPARLRPDAHGPSDCLHLMAGSGVMEGWTRYVWHFVGKEIPSGRY